MADITDVLTTLASTLTNAFYPNGTTGQAEPSITGYLTYIYPGWPQSSQLDADMAALGAGTGGRIHVSIFPLPTEQNTTRFAPKQQVMSTVTPTLTLTMNAAQTQITVGGSVPTPFSLCNMAVLIAGQAFLYAVQPTDTLSTIAAGLATAIAAQYPSASSAGAVISLAPGTYATATRVGTSAQVTTEWERQQVQVQIDVWAADPTGRADTGNVIKTALAQIAFLTMPDGFGARVRYVRSQLVDDAKNQRVYRRTFIYTVEYATTTTQSVAEIIAINSTTEPAQAGGPCTPEPTLSRSY
jgi:hypothetical protein